MPESVRPDFTHDQSHKHCLGLRPVGDDDELFIISEWSHAIGTLLRAELPAVTFFVLRHLLELVLKRIVEAVPSPIYWLVRVVAARLAWPNIARR
jgi:hypothetical protein